jgi:aldehyde dehydrogenase family 7 protein A1
LSRTISGSVLPSERPDHFMMERWSPLMGHVGVITAFNFPCAVFFWNAALSLVCGNTNLWKGSETTSLVHIACMRIVDEVMRENNIPGAVASLITGRGNVVGEAMLNHPSFELISFTGSTRVGRHVSEVTAKRFGKKILELGGNNAMIIMNDADLSMALRGVLFSAVGTAGQRCTTARRLYVQEGVYDSFLASLTKAYSSVKIGDPLESGTLCGPLHTRSAVTQFNEGVKRAVAQGGRVAFGGRDLSGDARYNGGNFVEPTIIEMTNADAACVKEELFVPILYVMKVKDLTEAIRFNNSVPQGLASSLFTKDQSAIFQWTGAAGSDCGVNNTFTRSSCMRHSSRPSAYSRLVVLVFCVCSFRSSTSTLVRAAPRSAVHSVRSLLITPHGYAHFTSHQLAWLFA